MLFKLIYILGEKFRNPSLKKRYDFLKKSECWSLEQLDTYQFKRLKSILNDAFNSSEYYQNKFKEANLNISDIKSLKNIEEIPILSKVELLNNVDKIHTDIKFKSKYLATTSGTSGKSLKFYRNEEADSFNRAASIRGYSWYNVKPWERNGYFWGINFCKKDQLKSRFLDFLQNRFRIFSYNNNELKKFMFKTQKATYLQGYSSMIYQIALLINKQNIPTPKNIKMVKGTSEKIFDSYQKDIEKAFGVKMISEYGATEAGLIAFECPRGSMHINMEGVLVEEIDDEILVTNLQMNSFPIIRYKLGDYIKLAPKNHECSCGMKHRVISDVTGRIGDIIYGKQKEFPSLYFYYIFKNLSNNDLELNYQVIQEKKGHLTFLIEQKLNTSMKNKVSIEVEKYFNSDIEFSIKEEANFVLSDKGKLKNFISNIKND